MTALLFKPKKSENALFSAQCSGKFLRLSWFVFLMIANDVRETFYILSTLLIILHDLRDYTVSVSQQVCCTKSRLQRENRHFIIEIASCTGKK